MKPSTAAILPCQFATPPPHPKRPTPNGLARLCLARGTPASPRPCGRIAEAGQAAEEKARALQRAEAAAEDARRQAEDRRAQGAALEAQAREAAQELGRLAAREAEIPRLEEQLAALHAHRGAGLWGAGVGQGEGVGCLTEVRWSLHWPY